MNNKENDIIYNAQDIEQYFAGKLSPLQMHAMEKAALDDLFLAEAMEGYGEMKNGEWKNDLAALKNEFETNGNTAKVIALPRRNNNWLKIAAAVLLIGGTATIAYLLVNKKDNQQIAQTVQKDTAPDTVVDKAITKEIIPDSISAQSSISEPLTANNIQLNKIKAEDKIIDGDINDKNVIAKAETKRADSSFSNFVYRPDIKPAAPAAKTYYNYKNSDYAAKANSNPALNNNAAPTVASENNVAFQKAEAVNKTNANIAANGVFNNSEVLKSKAATEAENYKIPNDKKGLGEAVRDQQLNKSFIAQVVAADNTPLPFANISIKSENFGTYADVNGNFRLVAADSLLTVEIKSAGYQNKLYTLQSNVQQNKIVLTEDALAFKEKTVVGYGIETKGRLSRRATLLKDSVVNVEPADGWDNYNTYVNNNIEIPDDILKNNIHGQVEISFDVRPNGSITNIKVDKSLCDNCDEAAKRLIEQGPQWKTKTGKRGKGKITVQF
ncbi:TonB family protein [Ferruginibacter sp.]